MTLVPPSRRQSIPDIIAGISSIFSVVAGCVVLVGWSWNIPLLKSVSPDWASMKVNTATGFILAGVSLWILREEQRSRVHRFLGNGCAAVVTLLGMLSLGEHILRADFGIDQLPFKGIDQLLFKSPLVLGEFHPGRMSPAAAVCFVLVGLALLGLDWKTSRGRRPTQPLPWFATLVGLLALAGYLYDAKSFYDLSSFYSSMAAPTAVLFIVIPLGVICARPERWPLSILTGKSPLRARHKVVASLAGAVLLVALVVTGSFRALIQIEMAAEARAHSHLLIGRANALLSSLKDIETGQRGYMITGDESFLEPYTTARDGIDGRLEELRQLTRIDAAHKHLDLMVPLVIAKMAETLQVIELRRKHDLIGATAIVSSGRGKRLMDSIRDETSSYLRIEEDALAQHERDYRSYMGRLVAIIITASVLMLLFALLCVYFIYREAQNQLRKAGSLQSAIFQSATFSCIATDTKGVIQIFNVGAERMLGYTASEVVNKITPADLHDPQEVIARAQTLSFEFGIPIAPGFEALAFKASRGVEDIYETTKIRKDGSRFSAILSVTALRDPQNAIIGYLLIATDNTARKRAEESSERFFRLSQDMLCILGFDGYFKELSPAWEKTLGYTKAEILASPFIDFVHPDDRQITQIEAGKIYAGNTLLDFENRYRCKDGSYRFFQWSVTPVIADQLMFGAARDVTERKLYEQALQKTNVELESAKITAEQANLAKSDFLSSMSHELRTPLNAILGFAQLMEATPPAPTPDQTQNIRQILKAGWYLLNLINQILDLSGIEAGKMLLTEESVSLSEILSESQAMMEPQARQHGIQMNCVRFRDPFYVRADRTRLKQIVVNLLTNAIKYNKEDGQVIVDCTRSAPERVRFSIRDTGVGLSPEKLKDLFQPFNRLGQEAGAVAGTGIGLVVSKRFAELMGGTIGVESTVGEGSVFWCELAAAEAPELPDEMEAGTLPQAMGRAPRRTVLYVEDSPANLQLVQKLMKHHSEIRLLTATNGILGIEAAQAFLPTVILMDIGLPDMGGINVMKTLREDPATAHIPIVALSANAMPRDIKKGLKAGFFRYLTKPINVKKLMDTLNVALEFAEKTDGQRTYADQLL